MIPARAKELIDKKIFENYTLTPEEDRYICSFINSNLRNYIVRGVPLEKIPDRAIRGNDVFIYLAKQILKQKEENNEQ